GRCRGRRPRTGARGQPHGTRSRLEPGGGRGLRTAGSGRHRHQRRDRTQLRTHGEALADRAPRPVPGQDARRCSRPRRRADAADLRRRRSQPDKPRSASHTGRGVASNREEVADFELRAPAVIVTSGGIGHNFELMEKHWPTERLGRFPDRMLAGVPAHVDGRMLQISEDAGANLINRDRIWAYTEGIENWNPIWPDHGIRIIPGPSSMWFDAEGNRFPAPNYPGFDTNRTMAAILRTGYDYSWFMLNE